MRKENRGGAVSFFVGCFLRFSASCSPPADNAQRLKQSIANYMYMIKPEHPAAVKGACAAFGLIYVARISSRFAGFGGGGSQLRLEATGATRSKVANCFLAKSLEDRPKCLLNAIWS